MAVVADALTALVRVMRDRAGFTALPYTHQQFALTILTGMVSLIDRSKMPH